MLSSIFSNRLLRHLCCLSIVIFPFQLRSQCTPVPIAYNGLTIGIPLSGSISLSASALDAGSIDECGSGPLIFSYSADPNDQHRVFDCASSGTTQLIELWVTDQNGGQNFVETYLLIQDGDLNCPSVTSDCGPVAIVYNGLSIDLSGGVVSLPASAFNAGSLDLCNTGNLTFEVAPVGSNIFGPSITFDCNSDLATLVQFRATDGLGNLSTVETFLIINDQLGVCGGPPITTCGPVPILMNGLAVALPGDGQLDLPVSSVFLSSIDGCNTGNIETTVARSGDLPDFNVNSLLIDCNDAGNVILVDGHIRDNAGNETFSATYTLVQDNIAPTLSEEDCAEGLSVDLLEDGTLELSSQEFLFLSPADNCGTPQLSFSADINDDLFSFNCSDIEVFDAFTGSGVVNITVWATDGEGNQANCDVEITVNDKLGVCLSSECTSDSYELSGTIASDYYRASDYITASGEIDSPVRFQAAESITLLPGFQAASGTTFRAVIAPCTLSIPFIQPPVLEIQTRELEVKVFPNPLRRQSQVQIHALQAGSLHISLKDQMGRTIQQLADQTHYDDTYWEGTIESMDLPAGMYFLQVINGQQRVIQKLVRM